MLEVLAVLSLMSAMTLLVLGKDVQFDGRHFDFMNGYLLTKSEAMLERRSEDLDDHLFFYSNGNISVGRTYEFGKHRVLVHLGNGYLTYE